MNISELKSMSYNEVREQYRMYLESGNLSRNTIATAYSDTFYLWRKESKEAFWVVVESENFEDKARLALRSALQANTTGNVDMLLGRYLAHLRRFRNFAYSCVGFAAGSLPKSKFAPEKLKGPGTVTVPRPSVEQVTYYLRQWGSLENYHLQECALNKLFHQLCPENKTIEDILLKAATLNERAPKRLCKRE